MSVKTKLLIILLSIFVLSCSINTKSQNSFTLNVIVNGNNPKYLYLEYGNIKDSALVQNGRCYFKGEIGKPTEASFSTLGISTMVGDWFYLENEIIQIQLSIDQKSMKGLNIDFIKVDSISGSKTELTRTDFELYESTHINDVDWNSKLFKKLDNIITNNPSNTYSTYVFIEQLRKEILNKNQVKVLYRKIDTSGFSKVQLENLNEIFDPSQTLDVGKQLMDFTLSNAKKELISTKDFRGKLLLIDFWASWCGPCRKQNPDLLKVYEEYKNENFDILGVSIDKDFDKWILAVEKDGLIWENVIDSRGNKSEILAKYGATYSVPQKFLIDENGLIISKNISIIDLKKILKNYNK